MSKKLLALLSLSPKLSQLGQALLIITTVLAPLTLVSTPARAQAAPTIDGTVVSSSRNTVTIRTAPGEFQLFVYQPATRKPADLPVGAQVRIYSVAGSEPGVRIANNIIVMQPPTANDDNNTTTVPSEVRSIERGIEKQAKRFQLGVRAGVALDPELLLLGAQVQIGPFFGSNIYFRPNIEFAYGEVTALVALNPEFIYRLPISPREGKWSTYVGAGPGFNFTNQSFQRTRTGDRIDFSEFESDIGFNILGGLRYRNGLFLELKTSVYSSPSPTLRMIVGYSF